MKPAAFAVLTSLALLSSGTPSTVAQGRASAMQAPVFEVDPVLAEAAAEPLGDRLHNRRLGGCRDNVWTIHRPNTVEANFKAADIMVGDARGRDDEAQPGAVDFAAVRADTYRCLLQGGAAGARLRPGRQSGEVVGGPGAGFDWPDSNHGITVDHHGGDMAGGEWPKDADPEVRQRRQVSAADRQARRPQRQQRHRIWRRQRSGKTSRDRSVGDGSAIGASSSSTSTPARRPALGAYGNRPGDERGTRL